MKISNLIKDDGKCLQVTKVSYAEGYKIGVVFSDGKNTIVDFDAFLSASRHPEIRKYLDPELFREFKIQDGNLVWNDYDLIFPIEDLYTNDILHMIKETVA